MGRTFRSNANRFDDEYKSARSSKHAKHSNNHKAGGMRIINASDYDDEDDNYFVDDVSVEDNIVINKYSGKR